MASIQQKHEQQAKASTSVFARSARRQALATARRAAEAESAQLRADYEAARRDWQARLDAQWDALVHNDPATVLASLAEAFEDNDAASAAVGMDGAEVTLVVIVPPVSSLPERHPTVTAAGNLSLRKLTKTETADIYKQLVCGHLLATLKEAFAVAPGVSHARIVAVRSTPPDAYGVAHFEALVAGTFERISLVGIHWERADAVQVVRDASSELLMTEKGATRQLAPLDLSDEHDLRAVVAAVELDESGQDD